MDDRSTSAADASLPTSGLPAPRPPVDDQRHPLTVCLFADVRGYTRFTAVHGAEAAADLAQRFTGLAADVVAAHDGHVVGTWGDQVLAEFPSARAAVRAAMLLQERCGNATLADPARPLPIGIGIDVGEPAQDGTSASGDVLNLAARLCAAAGPQETLATPALVHLAGAVDNVKYVDRGRLALKGLGRRPVLRVRPAVVDAQRQARLKALSVDPMDRDRWRRRWAVVAGLTAAALVAASVGVWAVHRTTPPPTIAGQSVGLIDPGSGALEATVPVGSSPEGVTAIGNDLWVANTGDDSVSRIDQRTDAKVDTVGVGNAPVAVAVLGDRVWVTNSLAGTVSQISTRTNKPVGDPIPVGSEPTAITTGYGWVWVANEGDGTVSRIDPKGQLQTRTVNVGEAPDGLAIGDGSVWVANRGSNTVSRIDPDRPEVTGDIRVGAGPRGIAVTPAGVWVANSLDLTVSRIDPRTDKVDRLRQVGDTPTSVVQYAGSVWVSDAGDGTITEVNDSTGEVGRRLLVGSSPHGLAATGAGLWVVAQATPAISHRGGVLTIAATGGFYTVDPAIYYGSDGWAALGLVYDGLVTVRRAPGAAGYELVPDLAETLPTSPDGQTYRFRLRPGIRYSDGRPLLASDIKRGLERTFTTKPDPTADGNTAYYDDIDGAVACNAHPEGCRLDRGIEVSNELRTVTFHLTHPDPDFLAKLAMPFATAAPPGASWHDVGTQPFAGTGPYKILQANPGVSLTLVRNPNFHQWSSAAQPAGYPDVIRWVTTTDSTDLPAQHSADLAAAEQGRADVTGIYPGDVDSVGRRYPDQMHSSAGVFTTLLVLDTARPPFKYQKARDAVAVGLDRGAFLRSTIGADKQAACTLVPRGYPGFPATDCPFAPDVNHAQQLVKDSHTWHMPVNLYIWKLPQWELVGKILANQLDKIGYRTHLVLLLEPWGPAGPSPATKGAVNAYSMGWGPDFPAASQYYDPLFSCAQTDQSLGHWCDQTVDKLAKDASDQQVANPGKAAAEWKQVYASVDHTAVAVPLLVPRWQTLVSTRLQNYQETPFGVPVFDQMWVR